MEQIPSSGKLLDYGCGHGLLLCLCHIHRPNLELIGLDPDQRKKAIIQEIPFIQVIQDPEEMHSRVSCALFSDVFYAISKEEHGKVLDSVSNKIEGQGIIIVKEIIDRPILKAIFNKAHEILTMHILKITKGSMIELRSSNYYIELLNNYGCSTKSFPIDKGYIWPHFMLVGKVPNNC